MSAYNAEKYIQSAITSVIEQSYTNLELIIVNDGSKDSTEDIIREAAKVDKRIILLNQKNKGQSEALNNGYKIAQGNFIKFFDSDDLLSPNFIEIQLKRLEGFPNAVSSAQWGRFYNDNLSTFSLNPESVWRDMNSRDWLIESLANGPNMMQCALWLIPRSILEKSGLWNKKLSLINDFDFFIRVLLSSERVLFAQGATLYYRSGNTHSLSNQKSKVAIDSAILSINLGVNRIISAENTDRAKSACAKFCQHWAYELYLNYPEEANKLESKAKELGGCYYPIPGRFLRILSKFIGWRNALAFRQIIFNLLKKRFKT